MEELKNLAEPLEEELNFQYEIPETINLELLLVENFMDLSVSFLEKLEANLPTKDFGWGCSKVTELKDYIKEKEIKELFPDVPTYVTYNAPFWRLRIGDFRSHEEAYHMQRLLMDAFPAYRKEMYIVREEVKIPLN